MRHGLAVDGLDTTPFASTRQTSFRAAPPAGKRRGISRRREGEKRIRAECEDTEIRAHSLQHTCTNFSQCANLHEWWLFVKTDVEFDWVAIVRNAQMESLLFSRWSDERPSFARSCEKIRFYFQSNVVSNLCIRFSPNFVQVLKRLTTSPSFKGGCCNEMYIQWRQSISLRINVYILERERFLTSDFYVRANENHCREQF